MASGRSTGSLLDELSCPLCRQPYTEPVVLDCGHVFCRECISRWWEAGRARRCPECGGTVPGGSLQPSRALDRLVQQIGSVSLGPRHCGDHRGEELELFCDTDKKFLCVMCLDRRDGRSHRAYNFMLIGEAVEIHRGKLKVTLNSLKQWKSDYLEFEAKQQERIAKIKDQSSQLQDHIASEFSKLRSALDGEQEKLFNDLRVQEKGVLARMEMNLGDIQNALLQTEEMLAEAQKQLESHDIYMLVKDTPLDDKSAEDNYQPMIKEGKMTLGMFQGPIQYRVWKQVKDVIRPVPAYLTLNPNTAHPRLLLSDDLTLVSYSNVKQDVPDNPERFDTCVCVLGAEAFTFGKHYWEVQVGTKTEWDVGVVKESISRKGHTTATPDAGYWIVWLRNGNEYKATTVPRTRLSVTVKPKAIGVYLDYESGQVSFYNVDDMTHLYTFTDTFLERLFPYFSPGINDDGQNSDPMKIFPVQYHDE